ncbi:MAG: hypothetical protein L0H26_06640, partial [Microlunatus sp.]|nr:hypothetical protein [Microlunatus sp.]
MTPQPGDRIGTPSPDFLDVDKLIADQRVRIAVICGAGGVGKTTGAAARDQRPAPARPHLVGRPKETPPPVAPNRGGGAQD